MVDNLSAEQRSKNMAAIRSKDTKPELKLRRALWARGLRYRVNFGKQKIDVAFPSRKLAIFVDGCFWHSCPLHASKPRSNEAYWLTKLSKNVQRDLETNELLRREGWLVIRFWEHELNDIDEVLKVITVALNNLA
jgi:DNA mismatch endonuclease (patch repair protein)